MVRNGRLVTPDVTDDILEGITRDTLITLARHMGYTVREELLPREALYCADEVFLCGTAAEISPVRAVDGVVIGRGARGPITKRLQEAFFGLFSGKTEDRWGWLDPVPAAVKT